MLSGVEASRDEESLFVSDSSLRPLRADSPRMTDETEDIQLVNRWTKLGLIIASVFAVTLALTVPSVVSIWYTIGTCIIPGLLVPVLASYFEKLRIPASYTFAAMLLGWLTSTASLIYGFLSGTNNSPNYLFGLEPMYPGLLVAVVVWGAGKIKRHN